ncbi:MAG TPA: tripartite tricarboxylate transporter substrate-binding protein [Xanthobacteraceae bacterium]|nr:tripartite tricarboxylate transporter substrate-binding protein [Xanthobacteraceae bacterium]
MKRLLAIGSIALGLIAAGFAPAAVATETYPSRTITLIVPYSAGGPTDTLARILADAMRRSLGQAVIVENVAGAGSTIGVGRVAHAAPDGYTIVIGTWTSHVGAPAIYPVQFDILADFAPVSLLPISPTMIIGRKTLSANTLQDLIGWLRANPDEVLAGTVGAGSPSEVLGIFFQQRTGTRFRFVPYKGGGPAMQDLVAGHIDLRMGSEASQTLPFLRSGTIKAFAILGPHRWPAAPEIPTVDEAGVPGLYLPFWNGMWVPKGTPNAVVARLDAAVVDALANEAVRTRLTGLGMEIPARDELTPQALAAFHKAEIAKWWPIIKSAGIKLEQ